MKAAILAVGSELLGVERLDTNSLVLTAALERHGAVLVGKSVVADDEASIAGEIRRWMRHTDLILVTGGLGPTADDVTRPAVAAALARRISVSEVLVEQLRRRFAAYGREMPEVNRRQAELIEGAELLENRRGSAPGVRLEEGETTLFLFPGVPRELEKMIELHLEPWLRERAAAAGAGAAALERRVLKAACLAESEVEQRILPAYERFGREGISVLASPGEVQVHLSASGDAESRRRTLDAMADAIGELLGDDLFTTSAELTLEGVVGEALAGAGRSVTTAESCTGGLLAERLTRVPGSSAYYLGGVVTYTDELKRLLLGVPAETLAGQGAVSEPVAVAMAQGVRERYGSDFGVGITGIAGPGGGSDEKPVGTVHLALAGPEGWAEHRCRRFLGDRQMVRWQSSQLALEMLRRRLSLSRPIAAVPPPRDGGP